MKWNFIWFIWNYNFAQEVKSTNISETKQTEKVREGEIGKKDLKYFQKVISLA